MIEKAEVEFTERREIKEEEEEEKEVKTNGEKKAWKVRKHRDISAKKSELPMVSQKTDG